MTCAARGRVAAVLCLLWGCAGRLYEGPPRRPEHVAVIHVGSTVVRLVDTQKRRGGAFDASQLEIEPGPHRLGLVFELPAMTIGMRALPARTGTGMCLLDFTAEAGRQYYLGSRARGEPHVPRWDGSWEAWVRDPSLQSDDDVIARCVSEEISADAAAAGAPLIAAAPIPSPAPAAEATAAPGSQTPAPPIAAAPAGAAPSTGPATIRIGEWHLRELAGDAAADITPVAAAIDASFDLLVVDGIVRVDGGYPAYDTLLRALPLHWTGLLGDDDSGADRYAVLYRRDRVRPCSGAAVSGLRCFDAVRASAPGTEFRPIAVRLRVADDDVR